MVDVINRKSVEEKAKIREIETRAGTKLKVFYGPEDVTDVDYKRDIGNAAEFPYVRSFYPPVAPTRPSSHGQYDNQPYMGVGTAGDTRARFEYLRKLGIRDLNLAFDLPTQMGWDSDDPRAYGEVGRVGLSIDTLKDMEELYEGIDLGGVSTNMTINATAIIIMAMYYAIAEKQGVPFEKLEGTPQNDIIKEMVARGAWVLDLEPAVKLVIDLAEWCVRNSPLMHPISTCGGHYCQSGATLTQGIACAFESHRTYIDLLLERGLAIDDLGRALTFLEIGNGGGEIAFFESIAASRAARRMWSKMVRDEYGAQKPRTMRLLREQSSAANNPASTAREPECNIIRGALVGISDQLISPRAQTGHAGNNGNIRFDGAYAIPTETSHRLDNLQRQVIVDNAQVRVTDPLGGSYYIEAMTRDMEKSITHWMEEIRKQGGIVKAIKDGYIQQMIARSSYTYQRQLQTGEKVKIGVNKFTVEEEKTREPEFLRYDASIYDRQLDRLKQIKAERDSSKVETSLAALREAAIKSKADRKLNLMPWVIDCVNAYATVGEIFKVFREEFGEFREPGL